MKFEDILPILFGDIQNTIWPQAFQIILGLSPFLLVVSLYFIVRSVWVKYVRAKFFFSQKYVLMEIRLPKDLFKSPKAMELFLLSLHQTGGEGNWYSKYWLGMTRPWFSLEMVSVEGQVKFYIWMRAGNKAFTESSLYAQFPGIEITEKTDDYARSVHSEPTENGIWACELQLTKEDAYPIKTYVDYGLDKDPKEEFKVDPMAPLVEFLGSVGPNQQVWIQILVRAHKKEARLSGHLWKTTDKWKDGANRIINEILIRDSKTKVSGADAETGFSKMPTITSGEREIVEAIERSITKPAFDVGIRCVYIAKNGFFTVPVIGGILGSFKQFSTEHLNGFRPNGNYFHAQYDYPWQDFRNIRRNRWSKMAIMAYKRRSYFYKPFERKPFVLNTEELVTIFHFPGQVMATPTLSRIPSKKSEAPTNLPI